MFVYGLDIQINVKLFVLLSSQIEKAKLALSLKNNAFR